jgi:hypothetical protein
LSFGAGGIGTEILVALSSGMSAACFPGELLGTALNGNSVFSWGEDRDGTSTAAASDDAQASRLSSEQGTSPIIEDSGELLLVFASSETLNVSPSLCPKDKGGPFTP